MICANPIETARVAADSHAPTDPSSGFRPLEEIIENPIQTEIVEQNEPEIAENPIFPISRPKKPASQPEPPVSKNPMKRPNPASHQELWKSPLTRILPISPIRINRKRPNHPIRISRKPLPKSRKKRLTQIQRTSRLLKKFLPKKRPFPKKAHFPTMRKCFLYPKRFLEYGYAYAAAYAESVIYEDAALTAPLFTLKEDGGVLLITEETETAFKVWWLTYADEPLSGYIAKSDISDISISEENRQTLKEQRPCGFITSDIGYMDAFVLFGELTISEEAPEATPAPEPQAPFLQAGDYAAVTTEPVSHLSIDESMTEDDNGKQGNRRTFALCLLVALPPIPVMQSKLCGCEEFLRHSSVELAPKTKKETLWLSR